jgi:hypothetical protein
MNYENDISLSLAVSAHSGTSFSPEKRGESERASYAAEIAGALETMTQNATKGGTLDLVAEEFERFRAGYAAKYRAYLSSKSRCMSTMITGASNFPVRRQQKRNDVAHSRLNELLDFRARAMKAALTKLRPDLRPIMAGDSDATTRLQAEIEKAEQRQANMKAANAAIRKHKKAGPDAQVAALVALGYIGDVARELIKPDCCGRIGFADYETSNNNANIRRMRQRLESLQVAKAAPTTEIEGAAARVEDDPPANRVRLFFPGKPSAEVRDRLKSGGFRWAPSIGAWQAYRHNHTIELARQVAEVRP